MTSLHDVKTTEQLATLNVSVASDAPKKRGRPALHENAAAKQKAYRERLRARGMREVSRIVRDVRDKEVPLHSDTIDLSEVRGCW